MIADFLDYFKTDKYDNKIILKTQTEEFSVKDVKRAVFSKVLKLKNINNKKIILLPNCNLKFFVNFFACVFAGKDIYLNNDNNKQVLFEEFYTFDEDSLEKSEEYYFEEVNSEEVSIYFYTSGSTSNNKCIRKTLQSLINESRDLSKEFAFGEGLEFITTTTLNHLFGMTFYFMLPMNTGCVINVNQINFPEDITHKNAVLVSTPSFLKQMKKYECTLKDKLNYIISAGSKLENDVFQYVKHLVEKEVIDIYGSTETGIIAYRTFPEACELKLFDGIEIVSVDECETKIKSDYSPNEFELLGDKIEQNGSYIKLVGRRDNILKIQEKRVSATELEAEISKSDLVEEACCVLNSDKIACLVALSEKGMEFVQTKTVPELTKLLKNELSKKFEIIPQKWKFINSLPRTMTGKLNKKRIEEIFNLNLSLPIVLKDCVEAEGAEFTLYFYRHCNFFKGHFENFPLLAGVVQIYFAAMFAKWVFGLEFGGGQYKRIKFSNIIAPDKSVRLKLEKVSNGIKYSYENENFVYSSGLLPYKNIYGELS